MIIAVLGYEATILTLCHNYILLVQQKVNTQLLFNLRMYKFLYENFLWKCLQSRHKTGEHSSVFHKGAAYTYLCNPVKFSATETVLFFCHRKEITWEVDAGIHCLCVYVHMWLSSACICVFVQVFYIVGISSFVAQWATLSTGSLVLPPP